ncbi:MAG: transposase [Planctomycetota bacterium]
MTHHSSEPTNLSLALELLNEHGFDSMANVLQILFNEAMKIERTKYLGASPYERSDDRRAPGQQLQGQDLTTRMGVPVGVPQVRQAGENGERFYPNALERGLALSARSRAAIAEMYIQGLHSSSQGDHRGTLRDRGFLLQVSRATALLDERRLAA